MDDKDFIHKVVHLYENENLWYQIQQTAQNYVWKHCSPEAMKNKLAATLGFDKELSQPELETSIERHENNLPPVMVDEEIQTMLSEESNNKKEVSGIGNTASLFPPGHYYSPIADLDVVKRDEARIFDLERRPLPGIELHERDQIRLLQTLLEYYQKCL